MEVKVFKEFIGQKIKSVMIKDGDHYSPIIRGNLGNEDELIFELENGKKYRFYHEQYCCESVYIEDISGDINNLIGKVILKFEERTQHNEIDDYNSRTWTFYDIETIDHHIQIRWWGISNGYYSESVDFEEIKN